MYHLNVFLTIGATALAVLCRKLLHRIVHQRMLYLLKKQAYHLTQTSTPYTSDTVQACAKVPASRSHIFNVVNGVVANKGSLQFDLLSLEYIHIHVGPNSICD